MSIFREQPSWRARWHGPDGKWWALAAGIGIVVLTALVAATGAIAFEQDGRAMFVVGVLLELAVLCIIGSGLLTTTSRRLSQGGLTRETTFIDSRRRNLTEGHPRRERDRSAQDRRTVRMGTMALPLFIALIGALFW